MRPPSHSRTVGLALGALAVALVLSLGGCGKKPKLVDSPGVEREYKFPQTYPNPKLDPTPGQPAPGGTFP